MMNITWNTKCKRRINVRTAVEKPCLHILTRCPLNDQQILYFEERISDVLKISEPLQSYNGLKIYDVLKSFKGDSPTHQFDTGD